MMIFGSVIFFFGVDIPSHPFIPSLQVKNTHENPYIKKKISE
jgi:hypothetical protein